MNLLDPQYWNNLYETKETKWDIGYPSTPLKEYIDQLQNKGQSILIPGCGNGYEAAYLLEKGFTKITLVDISPLLTARLKDRFAQHIGRQLNVITGNFFELEGAFDLVLEQTFFCALDPSMRLAYAEKMQQLLKPGGKVVGLLFDRNFDDGPPFGGSKEEYMNLFGRHFLIDKMEPCSNSIGPRQGTELFFKLVRK